MTIATRILCQKELHAYTQTHWITRPP